MSERKDREPRTQQRPRGAIMSLAEKVMRSSDKEDVAAEGKVRGVFVDLRHEVSADLPPILMHLLSDLVKEGKAALATVVPTGKNTFTGGVRVFHFDFAPKGWRQDSNQLEGPDIQQFNLGEGGQNSQYTGIIIPWRVADEIPATEKVIEEAEEIAVYADALLKASNVPEALYVAVKDEVFRVIQHAKDDAASLLEVGPPVPELSARQIAAIKKRGRAKPWNKRPNHRMSCFEWVRDNYREWIPGLLQDHLRLADPVLYNTFKSQVSRAGGRPDWLDVPAEPEASLRNIADPSERLKRLLMRTTMRDLKRKSRSP